MPRKQYGLKFDAEWVARVDAAAAEAGVTRTALIESLVEAGLDAGVPIVRVVDERLMRRAASGESVVLGSDRVAAFRRAAQLQAKQKP